MVYVDVFVAGVGKWYEFKCEETALIRDIIKEISGTLSGMYRKQTNITS